MNVPEFVAESADAGDRERFTQDTPVLPQVWQSYAEDPSGRVDLLLTPHKDSTAAALASSLVKSIEEADQRSLARLAYNDSYVVVALTFDELLRMVLPLSAWWKRIWPDGRTRNLGSWVRANGLELWGYPGVERSRTARRHGDLSWFVGVVGRVVFGQRDPVYVRWSGEGAGVAEDGQRLIETAAEALEAVPKAPPLDPLPLWSVDLNRLAETALYRSRPAIKADAAERIFEVDSSQIHWAVIDTGIDATHPAFRSRTDQGNLTRPPAGGLAGASRVAATYDFTRLRGLVAGEQSGLSAEARADTEHRLRIGRAIDWDVLAPHLKIEHDSTYRPPTLDHGTHVGGIIGGEWLASDPDNPSSDDLIGICPNIELYDLRVFGPNGRAEEFAITAALQFARYLNEHSDLQVIHGVNLSLSLTANARNYAIGRTPVCNEAERLMANGVVVVAAAGNDGQAMFSTPRGQQSGFRTVAITDPGNAETVITVGATHRFEAHNYGVSYFSSRGPTGDGRAKPDLVAPGEKILAPVPGEDYTAKDGTSQATAHVSGAAAMLLSRYQELIGQPRRVKQVLLDSATDLGRERYFQGAGVVDVLRAMQSL